MAFLFSACSVCRIPTEDPSTTQHYPGVVADVADTTDVAFTESLPKLAEVNKEQAEEVVPVGTAVPDPTPAPVPVNTAVPIVTETRICPISGMNTLQGVCPFAKPKSKAKGGAKQKPKLQMEFSWETSGHQVSVSVRPHHTEHWQTMGLPNTASKEEIRKKYKQLALEHHPDKHPDNFEEAKERFEKISESYQVLKDFDGELAFRWDEHPDKQRVMEPTEAIRVFAKVGKEACEQNPLPAMQLRNLVKESQEIKVLVFNKDSEGDTGRVLECWMEATCADHFIKVFRRDAEGEEEPEDADAEYEAAPTDGAEDTGDGAPQSS